jgi:hypothetical protein
LEEDDRGLQFSATSSQSSTVLVKELSLPEQQVLDKSAGFAVFAAEP